MTALLIIGFLLAIYVGVSALVLFIRIVRISRAEWIYLQGLRRKDFWTNSYMAVDIKSGKVIEKTRLSDIALLR